MLVPMHPVRHNLVALGKKAERILRTTGNTLKKKLKEFRDDRRRVKQERILRDEQIRAHRQRELEYEQANADKRAALLDEIPDKAIHFAEVLRMASLLSGRTHTGPWMLEYVTLIGFMSVTVSGELRCDGASVVLASKSYRSLLDLSNKLDARIDEIGEKIRAINEEMVS